MNMNIIIMLSVFVLLGVLLLVFQGTEGLVNGIKAGAGTLRNVWILLLLALGIGGFLSVLIPQEIVSRYLGEGSGWQGLFIGWGVGAFIPGAPYTILPVAASLLRSGAHIAPVMTMVLSSSIGIAVTRIPLEIAFIGWRFTVMRITCTLVVPILGGVIAKGVNSWLKLF